MRTKIKLLVGVLVILIVGWIVVGPSSFRERAKDESPQSIIGKAPSDRHQFESDAEEIPAKNENGPKDAGVELAASFRVIANLPAREQLLQLAELRAELKARPKSEAIELLLSYLATQEDQVLSLDYIVGSGGELSSWPTTRLFALDLLGVVGATETLGTTRELLQDPKTADEGSILVRNLAWATIGHDTPIANRPAQAIDEIAEYAGNVLERPLWRANPSQGYLELYDAVPYTSSADLIALAIGRIESREIEHLRASIISLNKLVVRNPESIRLLSDSQNDLPNRGRGQLIALADASIPKVRSITTQWITHPSTSRESKDAFFRGYPTSFHIENHSLFGTINDMRPSQEARIRGAWTMLKEWQLDAGLKDYSEEIEQSMRRIESM